MDTFKSITSQFEKGLLPPTQKWSIETIDLARVYSLAQRRADKIKSLELRIAALEMQQRIQLPTIPRAYYS